MELAPVTSYGWWTTSVELSLQERLEACTGEGKTAEVCEEAAGAGTSAVEATAAGEARSVAKKEQTQGELPALAKPFIVICLFLLEAAFLYTACFHLRIPRSRWLQRDIGRWLERDIVAAARGVSSEFVPWHPSDEFSAAEEDCPEDLGSLEPTLQPDLEGDKDELSKETGAEVEKFREFCKEGTEPAVDDSEEAVLQVASPLRRRPAKGW